MAVFAQLRVEPDVHRQGEVAHCVQSEGLPQVYGNRDLHGFQASGRFSFQVLPVADGFRQHGGQVGGNRNALFLCLGLQHIRGHDAHHNVPVLVCFRVAAQAVGIGFRPADGAGSVAQQEAVAGFLRLWAVLPVDNHTFRRDFLSGFQGQVPGGEVLQEIHAAGSVRHGVEELHGNAVFIIEDPDAAGFQLFPAHVREGIGIVQLGLRGFRDGFQVIPEKAGFEAHKNRRESGPQVCRSLAEQIRIHRFLQGDRHPEHVIPVLSDNGRKNQRRVIQPVPLPFHCTLGSDIFAFPTLSGLYHIRGAGTTNAAAGRGCGESAGNMVE